MRRTTADLADVLDSLEHSYEHIAQPGSDATTQRDVSERRPLQIDTEVPEWGLDSGA